jgi:hypothetical protein
MTSQNTVRGPVMAKSRGRHARLRVRWVGPVFAVQAVLLALDAMREMDEAQVAELAGS